MGNENAEVPKAANANRVKYGEDPDVTFFFPNDGGALVLAEKHELARISEIFRKQLPPSNAEGLEHGARIVITDISFDIFNGVINDIYGGEIFIYEGNFLELLYTGKKYFLSELIDKAVDFLRDFLNAENLPEHFEDLDKFDIPSLNDRMKKICVSSPLEVIKGLSKSTPHKRILKIILESSCLPCSEYELYKGIVECFSKDLGKEVFDVPKQMRDDLGNLIFLIRFPTMTKDEVISCTEYPSLLTNDQFVDFLLFIEKGTSGNTLLFFSSQARIKCTCQAIKEEKK